MIDWPRDRLVAAVQLAWWFGAVPRPLPRTREEITPDDRAVIEAADAILAWERETGRIAFRRAGSVAEVELGDDAPTTIERHVAPAELWAEVATMIAGESQEGSCA